MTEIAIRTEGLGRSFGELRAVDGLTLEVPAGVIFGFLGPNGSGKTTTIRLLLGLLEPTAGQAWVLGHSVRQEAWAVRERAGALLEENGLYERLTAEENLEFYGRIYRLPKAERRARIRELLEHFGLWERRAEVVRTWSRGMRQKLALARALLHRPRILFLDEPTAGLDPVAAASLHEDLLSMVKGEGVTVFLTTHNLAEAEKLCALVGVIRQGRLLAVGTPEELQARGQGTEVQVVGSGFTSELLAALEARPEVLEVASSDGGNALRIRLQRGAPMAPLVAQMVQAGAAIEEVYKRRASLEETFLQLVEEKEG
ncbi:MAG: ABC transporter ATP-binding protein [Anaerolineae bacterium]|nr:ABC transporter ATP-binding protein [Anaerolineae bacterium]